MLTLYVDQTIVFLSIKILSDFYIHHHLMILASYLISIPFSCNDFSFGSGGGRRTLRIWPFYGHDVRDGEFDRRFALWPFVHWRTERPGDPTLARGHL